MIGQKFVLDTKILGPNKLVCRGGKALQLLSHTWIIHPLNIDIMWWCGWFPSLSYGGYGVVGWKQHGCKSKSCDVVLDVEFLCLPHKAWTYTNLVSIFYPICVKDL